MDELNYKLTKKHYERLLADGYPESGRFLCLLEGNRFSEYSPEQDGYKVAIERTPIPAPKTCESCKQKVPLPEDSSLVEIEKKVEAYREKLVGQL